MNRYIKSVVFRDALLIAFLIATHILDAQNPFVITSSTSSDFTITDVGEGFHLPNIITNQIGNGFSVDATFNTTGLNANDKTFIFGVGMHPSGSFFSVLMVYIQNRQVIVERLVSTPSGNQLFAMPSWNTTMYEYGKSNVHLYFWIDDLAMKMYMFEGSTNLANADVKRTCELQFYGMNSSLVKEFLTNTGNGTAAIIVPQMAAYFVETAIDTARAIKRSPIPVDAVQGGEGDTLNYPMCGGGSLLAENPTTIQPMTMKMNSKKPLNPTNPAFKNLPTSYPVIVHSEQQVVVEDDPVNHLSVSPVPTNDRILIDMTAEQSTNGRLEIVDMMGRTVYQQAVVIDAGRNQYNVSLKAQALSVGLYLIRLQVFDENTRWYTAKVILK